MSDLVERLRYKADEMDRRMGATGTQNLLREAAAALEAAREDADKLREMLRTVAAVGVVQLFDTARADVLAEFSLAELQEISRVTEHKRPAQVEHIYREGWEAAIDQARGKGVAGG